MRLWARLLSLTRVGRRLATRVARRLGRGRLVAGVARRLGRGRLAVVVDRGRLAVVVARRLGRGRLAGIVALAGAAMALGIAVGSSHQDAKRPSKAAVPAQAADAPLVVAATGALEGVAKRHGRRARRGGPAHYRRTARKRVPAAAAAEFLPLYREAERVYSVSWRLLASIHRQETAFSTSPSTYHGLNDFGCCAGPMQFNVTNGPPSTWKLYRMAFRDGRRPKRYPHRTRSHPSIYDDFDAIMAAGLLLSGSGAGGDLDYGDWAAAYDYYGHDLFGVTYASQVLARAEAWQRDGFCPNCDLDEGLVAKFDDAYGESVRQQLIADELRRKKRKKRKEEGDRKAERRDRHGRRKGRKRPSRRRSAKKDRPTRPSPPRARRRRTAPTKPTPAPPPATPPSTPPPTTAPPPADECNAIRKLLGCKP